MAGRRKRKSKPLKPKPKLPKMFECPRCGKITLEINVKNGKAEIRCGNCHLIYEMENVPQVYGKVDIYGKFIDVYAEKGAEIG